MPDNNDNNVERPQQPQEMSIINEWIGNLLMGETDRDGQVLICKVQPDGTLRQWALQVGRDEDGVERVFRVDESGRQENVLIVTDADGNKLPIAGTSEGVLRVDLSGSLKSKELERFTEILNELRIANTYLSEMVGDTFHVKDLGPLEAKP